jgi:hypothetical protein
MSVRLSDTPSRPSGTPIPVNTFEISLRQNVILRDDIFIIFSARDLQAANICLHSAYAINGDFGVSFLLVSQFHNWSFETSIPPPALAESPYLWPNLNRSVRLVCLVILLIWADPVSQDATLSWNFTTFHPMTYNLFFKVWCSALNQIVPLWAISPVSDSASPIRWQEFLPMPCYLLLSQDHPQNHPIPWPETVHSASIYRPQTTARSWTALP